MSGPWTPGPWGWFGTAGYYPDLYLATKHSGRRHVMEFKRWGMKGAQPVFQPADEGMVDAKALLKFEVGDRSVRGVEEARKNTSVYRMDICGIDCADARLIASAPEIADALDEILNYSGGADSALDDPYVMERAQAALAKAKGEAA